MNKTLLSSLLLVAAVALSACQKSDNGGGSNNSNDTYATTPCSGSNLTNCNGGYSPYNDGSIQFINYQGSYANGFCGCPYGYRPIMNPYSGLACAPSNFFAPFARRNPGYGMWGYSYRNVYNGFNNGQYSSSSYGGITNIPGQNNQWSSIPQVTYNAAISGGNSGCYANAAATCDIRQANSCGDGSVCRPTGGGTYLGICSYQKGTEGYQQANSCFQRQINGGYINICGYGGYSYGYNNGNGGYYGGGNLPNR